ncbi:MAG: hypothetical protein KTR16_02705 [Acidiferrobacterales bacterium]|nr:hypothetical protein [Acidiferrobacterales bacterium]
MFLSLQTPTFAKSLISAQELETQNWIVNDVLLSGRQMKITGDDPYVRTPKPLSLLSDGLAGAYFELAAPSGLHQYQFFYSTDGHGYQAADTITARVNTSDDGLSRIFLPFQFLTQRSPVQHVLTGLRIDFDANHPNAKQHTWQLKRLVAVPTSDAGEYTQFTPPQLTNRTSQRIGKKRFILNTLNKLLRDKAFLICYLLMLISLGVYILRVFKRQHLT